MSRPILMGNGKCYGKHFAERIKKEIIDRCISSYQQLITSNLEAKTKLTPNDIKNGMELYYTGMNDALKECNNKVKTCDCVNDFYNALNNMRNKYESILNNTSDYYKGMYSGFGHGAMTLQVGLDTYRDVLYHWNSETYGRYVENDNVCMNCKNFLTTKFITTKYGITREYENVKGECKYARDTLNCKNMIIYADDRCPYNMFNPKCDKEHNCSNCCDDTESVITDKSNDVTSLETNQSGNNIIVPKMSEDVFDFMTQFENKNVKECIWKTMQEYESNNKYEYVIYTEKWVYHINNGQFASSINIKGGMQ